MGIDTNDEQSSLMTKSEVAQYLRVSSGTVDRWVRESRLPYFLTPGRQIRFKRTDVEQFALTAGPKYRSGE